MLQGLVVGDDLTGACDTGHEFAARGHQTRVALRRDGEAGDADVLVVDTDSRYDAPAAAAEAVRAAIDAHPAAVVYKKVDSTLRGNLATEVDAALAATAADGPGLAVVAPASPATGRTTACGHHLVEGALVTDTEPGQDLEKGPESAHVPSLFADAGHPVDHVGIGTVARGPDAVAERLRELADEPRIVAADATHGVHFEAIAEGARRVDRPIVYVGSAGLAEHVQPPDKDGHEADDDRAPAPPDDARGILGIVGSVAPETLTALDAVPERALVVLDPEAAIEDPDAAAGRAAERAREAIDCEERAVATAATERGAVDRALAAGEAAGLSPRETRERVAGTLAAIAADVTESGQPRGLFLTGGNTAVGVLDVLDATAIALSGEAVEAGIPLGTIEGGTAAGTALITKAGAFGGRETVVNCLDRLAEV